MQPVEFSALITARFGKPGEGTCQWFLFCENGAIGVVNHSILGDIPTCQRCADKLGLDLRVW